MDDHAKLEGSPVGIGVDIVHVPRIARMLEERDEFALRWFTPTEIGYCSSKAHPARHFAGRLAAKEAAFKAVGSAWAGHVPWQSIEVVASVSGAPVVHLIGAVLEAAQEAGIESILVSISHCDDYAVATAIAARGAAGRPYEVPPD